MQKKKLSHDADAAKGRTCAVIASSDGAQIERYDCVKGIGSIADETEQKHSDVKAGVD